jgi:ABC-type sugar transport system substrate-binding protein
LCIDNRYHYGYITGIGWLTRASTSMPNLNVVVALITSDNDYQAEQAASATEVAARLGVKIQIVYADNDAVNQTQLLVKIIQNTAQRPDAIIVEPVGTEMIQVAKAAVAAGIGWGILNRVPDYLSELRRARHAPVFCVAADQVEVGRIQARQFAALVNQGNILYIEGPSTGGGASALRTKGMLSAKPASLEIKMLKGDWTERSGHHAIKSWLSLSTSRKLDIRLVGCQNDAMAMGARKAFEEVPGAREREQWLKVPFTGCDGVAKTGQDWVRRGLLTATVVSPPTAGVALEVLQKAIQAGLDPAECTPVAAWSFPKLEDLKRTHSSAS